MLISKAVIAAAGMGTRFLPITRSIPKEMLPLVDKPVIQYAVEEAVACGINLVVMITAQGKAALEEYFDRNTELERSLQQRGKKDLWEKIHRLPDMADICFIHQKEQLGLGHAVLSTKEVVGKEPFVLILPDDLFEQKEIILQKMLGIYQKFHGSVIALRQVSHESIGRYGVIRAKHIDGNIYQVLDLVEKPRPEDAPSDLAVMGRYVLTPEIFPELEATAPGRGGEIQLTDALRRLLEKQEIYGYVTEGDYYDAGTIPGWLHTTISLALKHPEFGLELRKKFFASPE